MYGQTFDRGQTWENHLQNRAKIKSNNFLDWAIDLWDKVLMLSKQLTGEQLLKLWHKYERSNKVDMDRLYTLIHTEILKVERGRIKVSPGLLTELRADRALVAGEISPEQRKRLRVAVSLAILAML